MSELSERARELAEKYVGSTCMEHCWCQYSEKNGDDYVSCEDKLVELIEQALLAERRLAMEEAALIVDSYWIRLTAAALGPIGIMSRGDLVRGEVAQELAESLRAAAEKEVGK